MTAIKNLSMQKDDGIVNVHCMATHEQIKFYNDDKYWNMDLKEDFMDNTRNLWRGNFNDKRNGSIFAFEARANTEQALTVSRLPFVNGFGRWRKSTGNWKQPSQSTESANFPNPTKWSSRSVSSQRNRNLLPSFE